MHARMKDTPTPIRAKESGIKTEVIQLTPDSAEKLLATIPPEKEKHRGQRRIARDTVGLYARQMKEGRWTLNGEPIIVSDKGFLMDGQHRCAAVVKSGIAIDVVMISGVVGSAIETIDQGKARTAGDVLGMAGYVGRIGAVMGTMGGMELRMRRTGNPLTSEKRQSATPEEIRELADSDLHFRETSAWAMKNVPKGFVIPVSMVGFLMYRFNNIEPDRSEDWMSGLVTGAMLDSDDPRLWIRTRLTREAGTVRKTSPAYRLAGTIKAWDRTMKGKKLTSESNFFVLSVPGEIKRIAY